MRRKTNMADVERHLKIEETATAASSIAPRALLEDMGWEPKGESRGDRRGEGIPAINRVKRERSEM
jgi:hypothetical protein